jgi:transcription antitermination protein NusB
MGQRRDAREKAVQFLFQHDVNPPDNLDAALDHFWASQRMAARQEEDSVSSWGVEREVPPPTTDEVALREFADSLIRGTLQHRASIDELLQKYVQNWELSRMAIVDRNVLRLALFEMYHRDDIPPVVTINEAVDIAKKFSTLESGKFVNGVLDKVKGDLMRPARYVP